MVRRGRLLLAGAAIAVIILIGSWWLARTGTTDNPAGSAANVAATRPAASANFDATRQTVTAPLATVADAVAAARPDVPAEQVTAFLLEGLRRHAHSTSGPLVFWSAFIIELGRRAQTHEQYDLLGTVDPRVARLAEICEWDLRR